MLLGIGLHASLSFFPAPWWVQDRTAGLEGPYDEFLWAVHGFRMQVFFLMSGFFTAMLWRRRGLGPLLSHRLRRVALPLALGLATIVPLTNWVGGVAVESGARAAAAQGDIFTAVFSGDVAGVEGLLDRGFDADMRTEPDGWTLLHAAAFTGDPGMVELLLSRGAEPAPVASASEGETPLGVAFHFGREEAAGLLVEYGGGEGPPAGVEWSDIPGWAVGAWENGEEGEKGEGDSTTGLDLSEAVDSFHHLWFLYFLLWLVAGFAAAAWIVDRRGAGRADGDGAEWPRRVMWLMIPLTFLPQMYMGGGGAFPVFGPDTYDGFLPLIESPHLLLYYAAFFSFGAMMYGRTGRSGHLLADTVGRRWWLILPVSIFIVLPFGLGFTFEPEMFSWPIASALQVLYAWGMCFGLIGLFRALLPRERRGVRYLSDSSYWLYLAHLPLVVAAQMLVRDWPIPSGVKFLGVSAAVTLLLLASYQLFVRYTPIGALLNGKKTRPPRRPPNPDAHATG